MINYSNKKPAGAAPQFKQPATRRLQFKGALAQLRNAVSAQSVKRPVAPPLAHIRLVRTEEDGNIRLRGRRRFNRGAVFEMLEFADEIVTLEASPDEHATWW
jgi:hypothetical protein